MPVPVIGECDGTVAGESGDFRRIDTGEASRATPVCLRSWGRSGGQFRSEYGASPGMGPPVVCKKRSFTAWPEDVFAARLTVPMRAEVVSHRGRQRHRPPTGFGLRWSFQWSSEHLHGVVLDTDRSRVEVHIAAPQAARFTDAPTKRAVRLAPYSRLIRVKHRCLTTTARRNPRCRARGSCARLGSIAWRAPRPPPPGGRTRGRSRRHGSSVRRPRSPGPRW